MIISFSLISNKNLSYTLICHEKHTRNRVCFCCVSIFAMFLTSNCFLTFIFVMCSILKNGRRIIPIIQKLRLSPFYLVTYIRKIFIMYFFFLTSEYIFICLNQMRQLKYLKIKEEKCGFVVLKGIFRRGLYKNVKQVVRHSLYVGRCSIESL